MDNYDRILSYLDGDMEKGEVLQFEEELKTNKKLASDLKLFSEIEKTLRDKKSIELRERLERISREYQNKHNNKRKNHRIFYRIAASIALFIIIAGAIAYLYSNRYIPNDKLYAEYFKPYPAYAITRSLDTVSTKDLLKEGKITYEYENYDEAITIFKQVLERGDNIGAYFYSANAYMELKQYDKAIISLNKTLSLGEHVYVDAVYWYLGLCYLINNETEKAIESFRESEKFGTNYSRLSSEILEKIEE